MAMGFDIQRYNQGDLNPTEEETLSDVMREIEESRRFIITDAVDGLAGYKAKVKEYEPVVVIHDYFKAMADDAMGEKVTGKEDRYVARLIDQVVDFHSSEKLIGFLCGHANREGEKSKGKSSTEHAWSDHITRRVDGAFRVISDANNNRIALIANEGRDFEKFIALTLNGKLYDGPFGEQISENALWVENYDENQEEEEKTQKDHAPKGGAAPGKLTPGQWAKKRPLRRPV
jgi:hypothetical protein